MKSPILSDTKELYKSFCKVKLFSKIKSTKIVDFYEKRGYNVRNFELEDPILKVTISKNNKTYLATVNVETRKVEYNSIEEEKQEE